MGLSRTSDVLGGNVKYSDTYWEDLRFPAQGINPLGQASDPDLDLADGCLLFDSAATETITGQAQISHRWKEGTSIYPHIHWSPTSTNTGNVYWRLEYMVASVNSVFSGSFTTLNVLAAGVGVTNTHQVIGFGAIPMTDNLISSIIKWKVSRIGGDGTDTYTADAKFLEFDIHFEVNSPGSREEYIK